MLTAVKMTSGSSQGERMSTWWSASRGREGHVSASRRRHSSHTIPVDLTFSTSKLRATSLLVWASKPGSDGSMNKWWHHEACLEGKQSCEDARTVGCVRKIWTVLPLGGVYPSLSCRCILVISHGTIYIH